ncbi:MAG: hypothetical protein ACRC35_12915 [Angustibacter sp.]
MSADHTGHGAAQDGAGRSDADERDQARTPSPAQDLDPAVTQERRSRLQDVVLQVHARFADRDPHQGRSPDPDDVADGLRAAIADAGLPEQPAPWLAATATEIAGDRLVVVDPRSQRVDDELAARRHRRDADASAAPEPGGDQRPDR